MPTPRTIAVGAGAVVAGLLALVFVHPWRSIKPDVRMSAPAMVTRQAAAEPANSGLPPRVAPTSSPEQSTAPRAPGPAETGFSVAANPSKPAPTKSASSEFAASTKTVPQFDVVRVEPSGDALLAGRGSPNATVSLMDRGKVVGEAKTDAAGNFVITPPALAPGDYALSLREGAGADAAESKQSVTVSVPKTKSEEVVVAMAEPGRPTTLLSLPPTDPPAPNPQPAAGAARGAAPLLAIRSVEVENGTGFYATGVAPARGTVRLYLNDARIADMISGPGGAWSITVRRGLAPGHYKVRADMIGAAEAVIARAEVPFDVPPPAVVADAEPAKPASPGPASPPPASMAAVSATSVNEAPASPVRSAKSGSPADVVLDRLATELVTRGDNLWRISRQRLGQGTRYTQIYAANAAQIRNPGLIYPGQVFVLPQD